MTQLLSRRSKHPRKRKRIIPVISFLLLLIVTFGCAFYISGLTDTTPGKPILKPMEKLIPNIVIPYKGRVYQDKEKLLTDVRHSGGSATYTVSPDAMIEFRFHGEQVDWIGFVGDYNAIVEIWIDGLLVTKSDLYALEPAFQHSLFQSEQLSRGEHVLLIKAAGKNPASKGDIVPVDRFLVGQGQQWGSFENDSSSIRYIYADHYNYLHFIARKLAHFIEFMLLTGLLLWTVCYFRLGKKSVAAVPFFMLLWALSDEYHQSYVSGRTPSWFDIGVDSVGIVVGFVLVMMIYRFLRKEKTKL